MRSGEAMMISVVGAAGAPTAVRLSLDSKPVVHLRVVAFAQQR
jgi:hypothetical protein